MFRGNYPTRIDEKGRLKVPAGFKHEIDERFGTKFYITSTDGKIAQLWPMEEWERVEQKIAAQPSMNPAIKKFLNVTSYYGQEVEMDGQGRLTLPSLLRDKANLKAEVAVIGSLNHLEIRVLEDFRKEIEDNPITPDDEQALSLLGI